MTTKTAFRIENGVKFVKIRGYLLIKSVANANAKEFTWDFLCFLAMP
jgi:hypothetical protein